MSNYNSNADDGGDADFNLAMQQIGGGGGQDGVGIFGDLTDRPLELGEKADDAKDYEDESELADDESAPAASPSAGGEDEDFNMESFGGGDAVEETAGGQDGDGDQGDLGDLDLENELFGGFGDDVSMTNAEDAQGEDHPVDSVEGSHGAGQPAPNGAGNGGQPASYHPPQQAGAESDPEDNPEYLLQLKLFQMAGKEIQPEDMPKTSLEEFEKIWPNFEPNKPPRFFSLIPRKRAYYMPKVPQKPPKLMVLSKVSLELAADQEKSFRLPSTASAKTARQDEEHGGLIYIMDDAEELRQTDKQMDLDNVDTFDERENIGNVSWNDLLMACEDWDVPDATSEATVSDDGHAPITPPDSNPGYTDEFHSPVPSKKRRLGTRDYPTAFSIYDHMDLPTWDDPELETARLSKKILLDMNDPHLLLDVQQPTAEPPKPRTGLGLKRDNRGSLANPMFKRYNISNDEAYDALKESSTQKVRSTIGHMNVEHSLPALKLQYPFYKVALNDRELRSFHRPTVHFKPGERASIATLKSIKRKHKKNLKPSEAFATAEDLNVGDNSDLLLAEYSEEYPTTLSNFGMGVKILNYYRRKDNEDTARPKRDDGIGETSVLLPQDKSPFSLFGQVEPGQEVLTMHNAMYRAPVFKHDPAPTDFLVSRSQTGVNGSKYYMRNIPNILVVGQQFPSVEVPGTHARKVTEASKKRLKMLAFRLYRRGRERGLRQPWVSNEMIKAHLPGTEIAQNRSRMREIMKYQKDIGTWEPMPGENIPEEPALRTWIKPEDVCLIDSMHAGDKQLQDAGIKSNEIKDDEEEQDGENMDVKLAPWNTTKNFLNACAGKAMLELHGEGDPTGQGLGFSFIKVSMKGGFRDVGESVTDRVDAKKLKELGGHSYNVQKQQSMYENAIKRIWNKQKDSLSAANPPSDAEDDVDSTTAARNATRPRSEVGTPALMRGDDDTMSQFSRNSGADSSGKKLRITRTIKNKYDEYEEVVETITDPEVIKLYLKRKKQERLMNMKFDDIKPSGDSELDKQQVAKLKGELARLQRNIERREGREKAKGITHKQADSGTPLGTGKGGATPRKCANCGEVGHIKTNKKCAKTVSFAPTAID
jgi:hypothetical protein